MSYSLDKTTPLLPGEEFRTHPKWPYDVSNMGRVRRRETGRLVGYLWLAAGKGRRPGAQPRHRITLQNAPRRQACAEVLVLETWIGPRPGPEWDADHIDHNRLNNCLSNLRWRLASENRADITR